MMTKLKGLLSRNPDEAMAVVKEPLGEIRAQLETLREQRAIVEAAPRALVEAEADIDRFIALAAPSVEVPAGYMAARSSGYVDAVRYLEQNQHITPLGLLCAAAPDQVRAWLAAGLHERYRELPEPMSVEQRQAELARLDAEIAEVERQEVELCWSLLDAGVEFDWRPDVSVELVLGLEPAPQRQAA